jgi:hypothetical protein
MSVQPSFTAIPLRWRSGIDLGFVVPTVLALLLLVGALAFRVSVAARAPLPPAPPPASPAIEDRWGIRITQLALTADGGLVDLRYQIIDPDKALPLIEAENANPQEQQPPMALVAEDSGVRITAIALMPPHHDLVAGRTQFLIFHNSQDAIRPGRPVTLAIGDLRLEHIVVQ